MNTQQLKSLKALLEYLQPDEQAHFEETPVEERGSHIYNDVVVLQKFVASVAIENNKKANLLFAGDVKIEIDDGEFDEIRNALVIQCENSDILRAAIANREIIEFELFGG